MDASNDFQPSLEELQAQQVAAAKSAIRQKIGVQAGDTETLLGITADAAQLATLFLAVDTVALAGANDFGEYKAAKLMLMSQLAGGDDDVIALSQTLLQQVQAGEVILPIMLKGVGRVLQDVTSSGMAVSGVLAASYQAE